jgi:HD superfamily phosphohydrolase
MTKKGSEPLGASSVEDGPSADNVQAKGWNFEQLLHQLEEEYTSTAIEDFWPREREAIRSALQSVATTLPKARYSPVKVLGVGGSGVVLLLKDSLFPSVDNALKFPRPVPGKVELVAELLGREIQYLAQLRHPGIVKILYYRYAKDIQGYGILPFYLMEAVDGVSSGKFVRKQLSQQSQFVSLVRKAAGILEYLHTLPVGGAFAHLDIKPDNFMVDHTGQPIMIDLGTCKRISQEVDNTTVACTRSFAHPQLIRQLTADPTDENRAKGKVLRSDIRLTWDLWSFGLMLVSWLGFDHNTGHHEVPRVLDLLEPYTRKYMLLLCARLLAENPPAWLLKRVGLSHEFLKTVPVTTASELRDTLDRLDGSQGPLARLQEFQARGSGTIQAAPGTHVPVTPALSAVLEHRLFRRLNTISQLGLVSQVYPGAKHTRREHSLGTYANTLKIVRVLYNDPVSPLFRQIITDDDCRDLLLASLLHDIGHFPLAHDLEDVDDKLFNHVELTLAMLKGLWEKKKRGSTRVSFESLEPIFKLWATTSDRLISILAAKPTSNDSTPKLKLLRSIISGPIDADKLDYLFRDARHLDLPYPNGVDVDRLFKCLTTVVVDRIDGGYKDIPVVGVHAKGKVSAEFLSMARYAMFSQAYWHHAVRAQKSMLLRAVEALLGEESDTKVREFQSTFVIMVCSLPESLYDSGEVRSLFEDDLQATDRFISALGGHGTDLAATDAAVLSWLFKRLTDANRPEALLIEGILRRNLFKRLWVVSRDMESQRWDKIVRIWEKLDRIQRHRVAHEFEKKVAGRIAEEGLQSITSMASGSAEDKVDRLTRGQVPWLLIDIPGDRPGSEIGLYHVLESQRRKLRKDDRAVGELERSLVWEEYARNLLRVAGKVRIFCDPDLVDSIEASVPWEKGIEDLTTVLERSEV